MNSPDSFYIGIKLPTDYPVAKAKDFVNHVAMFENQLHAYKFGDEFKFEPLESSDENYLEILKLSKPNNETYNDADVLLGLFQYLDLAFRFKDETLDKKDQVEIETFSRGQINTITKAVDIVVNWARNSIGEIINSENSFKTFTENITASKDFNEIKILSNDRKADAFFSWLKEKI